MNDTLLQIFFIFLLILFVITPYVILIYTVRYIRQRGFLTPQSESTLVKFFGLFIVLDLLTTIFSRLSPSLFLLENLAIAPLQFIRSILPTIIALWLVLKILPLSQSTNTTALIDDASSLKIAVDKLLNSDNFLTAIRTTLPKGERDSEYGLDYIPFMLHNIEERRKHFEKSSHTFLTATVVIGIILSVVVVFFGYILINDEAAGTPRTLSQIREESTFIRRDLNSLLPSYIENSTFKEYVGDLITNLETAKVSELNKNIKIDVQETIAQANKTGDIVTLANSLRDIEKNFTVNDQLDRKYLTIIKELNLNLSRFKKKQESAVPNLKSSLDKLDNLMANVNSSLGKSDVQTGEVLKRLAVSLIVSSFFLAILRYSSNLYRNNYQEMLRAQQDDLGVRRFYVAYKSSKSDPSTRGQILSKFINTATKSEENSDSSLDISKDDVSVIIKELLNLLTKKS